MVLTTRKSVNDIAKEFKCLISHCSVWNFESMWGTTEELWFDEYEHGGLPWDVPGKYREFSPHTNFEQAALSLQGIIQQLEEIFAAVEGSGGQT